MIVLISKLIRSTFGNWSTCWWTSFESASRKYKILQSVGGCVWINKHAIIWLFSFTSLLTGGTFRPDPARPHFGSLKHWNRSKLVHQHVDQLLSVAFSCQKGQKSSIIIAEHKLGARPRLKTHNLCISTWGSALGRCAELLVRPATPARQESSNRVQMVLGKSLWSLFAVVPFLH